MKAHSCKGHTAWCGLFLPVCELANDDDLHYGQALGFLSEIHLHNVIDGKERPLIATKIRRARQTAIGECHDRDCQWIAVQVIHGAKHCRRDPSSEA